MKTRRIFGDPAMRALLKDYSRPDADGTKFDSMLDAAGRSAKIVAMPRRGAHVAFGWMAAAAAILVLFIWAGMLLRGRLYLDGPLAAYRVGSDGASAALSLARQGELPAAPGAEIRFRTASESVAASSGARLSIRQNAFRVFGGPKGRIYRIDSGGLALVHFDPTLPFTVRTPFGDIRPLGTALSMNVDAKSLDLACTAGRIVFSPKDGGADIEIESGYRMLFTEGENIHSIEKMKDGEILPFAPTLPGIKEVPIDLDNEWIDAEPKSGGAENTSPSPKGQDVIEKKKPALKKSWSVDSGSGSADRMGNTAGSVLLLSGSKLSARDADTGKTLFSISLESRPDGFATATDAYLLFGSGLACIDAKTGKEKWRAKTGPISFSDIGASDGIVAVASADGYLYAVNALTGEPLSKQGAGVGMYGVPAVAKGRIVASALDARLRGFDPAGLSPSWSYEIGERLTGDRPVMMDGRIVLDADPKGGFFLLSAQDGAPLGKAKFSPPMKRWPISLGRIAAYQDADGIKLISAAGVVSGRIVGATGDLLAASNSSFGPALATSEGIWLAEKDGRKAERLMKADIAKAAIIADRAFVMDASGRLSLWELSDD
jgi:outer membrane protein assembly factor BamB